MQIYIYIYITYMIIYICRWKPQNDGKATQEPAQMPTSVLIKISTESSVWAQHVLGMHVSFCNSLRKHISLLETALQEGWQRPHSQPNGGLTDFSATLEHSTSRQIKTETKILLASLVILFAFFGVSIWKTNSKRARQLFFLVFYSFFPYI